MYINLSTDILPDFQISKTKCVVTFCTLSHGHSRTTSGEV